MKKIKAFSLSAILCLPLYAQEHNISGRVSDQNKQPIPFANVFIEGTLDGTSANDEGLFAFNTHETGVVTLKVSCIGYETHSLTRDAAELQNLEIVLKPSTEQLREVVVVAGNYALKSSTLESQNAVSLVTTAGSDGDLYRSLSMLPGTQISGTDGRLVVRGGEDRESQTFIDGMHVLSPYTANAPNSGARSKYSIFHFEGINFSTGGYSPEYSQSLSGILPLNTKDKNPVSLYGAGLMNVNVEGGGTQAWNNGSVSLSATYTDLKFYNATLYPSQRDQWDIPYRDFSVQNQVRLNIGRHATLKTYYTYSKTRFRRLWKDLPGDNPRDMNYQEDNLYLNTTFRNKSAAGIHYFAGIAWSLNKKETAGSRMAGDLFSADDRETHLKVKASKRFTNLYKVELGAETYLKSYRMDYTDARAVRADIDNNISGAFVSNDLSLTRDLFLNLSGRVEYSSLTDKYAFLPRLAVNYQLGYLILSAVAGKYQQFTDYARLAYNKHLLMETNLMGLIGAYYHKNKKIYRAEVYYKKYGNLPLQAGGSYTSDGYGYSRGVDLYFDDKALFRNFEYMATYSYNDSKRKYLHYPEKAAPEFITRHNASLTCKYTYWKLRSIFGVTNRFADGRPYHDPNKEGFINSTTSPYHSLDISLTVLPHPKVIVYASLSNVLNRKNVYGYNFADTPSADGKYASAPVTMDQSQAFYVGVFITLGKNAAYKSSHF